jgi:hypothetical protein
MRGCPRLLGTLARILSQPALDVSLPPPAGESPAGDDAPLRVELIHNGSRAIRIFEELEREQWALNRRTRKSLRSVAWRRSGVSLRRSSGFGIVVVGCAREAAPDSVVSQFDGQSLDQK